MDIKELEKISTQVRRDIIRMVCGAASGHPGGSLGTADFITALYFEIMRPDPAKFSMDGTGEDIFFLSNGHISPCWYSVLARYGYFDIKELGTFRRLNSRLQGHPTPADGLPGIRIASGSLGQGLSAATGAALAKRLNRDPHLVYCLTGDGELQEGQNWEALMFAAAHNVDNLIAVIDYNGKQIDGPVDKVLDLGDLHAKFESFGWKVIRMNGNDMTDVVRVMKLAITETRKQKPVVVLMKTTMGYGVDFMRDDHQWHGSAPDDSQANRALLQIAETLGDY
ncbi:MAG TPA: transketolase [Bacteroidales bacterium]|nr:transketolase [Bacteroidales bacterium]